LYFKFRNIDNLTYGNKIIEIGVSPKELKGKWQDEKEQDRIFKTAW
jgi:hypothetical protein